MNGETIVLVIFITLVLGGILGAVLLSYRKPKQEEVSLPIKSKDPIMDKVLQCAKGIIKEGSIKEDNASSTTLPYVTFMDTKGNTLYVQWFYGMDCVLDIKLNDSIVPKTYGSKILKLAEERIQVLREEHMERVVAGMKV